MPELPEVEIAKQQLIRWAKDDTIKKIYCDAVLSKKIKNTKYLEELEGESIIDIYRLGKRCAIQTRLGFLTIHLGMTGKLSIQEREHTRAFIELTDKTIYLVDTRGFAEINVDIKFTSLGKDPLLDEISPQWLSTELQGKKVKNALLRQDILCGIGNIQASEILFRARISPYDREISLSKTKDLIAAMNESIQHTIAVSKPEDDKEIQYLHEGATSSFLVYGRGKLPCFVCSETIERNRDNGRSTFFCRKCQGVT